MKLVVVVFEVVVLAIFVVGCSSKVSATVVERDLYAKIDKGDVAGAAALVTDDTVFEVLGCPAGGCKGRDGA